MDWLELVGWIIGIVGFIFGGVFYAKYASVVKLFKELGEAFIATSEALEDTKITNAELKSCLKEWMDVYLSILMLLGKPMPK